MIRRRRFHKLGRKLQDRLLHHQGYLLPALCFNNQGIYSGNSAGFAGLLILRSQSDHLVRACLFLC